MSAVPVDSSIRVDALKLLESEVFRHDEDLLPMQIRTENLRALTDNQDSVIRIKQAE